jgi:hypothetical protein
VRVLRRHARKLGCELPALAVEQGDRVAAAEPQDRKVVSGAIGESNLGTERRV